MLASKFEDTGVAVHEVKQTGYNLTEAVRMIEELILNMRREISPTGAVEMVPSGREFGYMDNDLIEWQLGNIKTFVDQNENIRFHKGQSSGKIDAWASLVNAFKVLIEWDKGNLKKPTPGIYVVRR